MEPDYCEPLRVILSDIEEERGLSVASLHLLLTPKENKYVLGTYRIIGKGNEKIFIQFDTIVTRTLIAEIDMYTDSLHKLDIDLSEFDDDLSDFEISNVLNLGSIEKIIDSRKRDKKRRLMSVSMPLDKLIIEIKEKTKLKFK